jgi:hypothetical protein
MKIRTIALITAAAMSHCLNLTAASDEAVGNQDGPGEVIIRTIQAEVSRQFREAGAICEKIEVTQAEERDSATPFQVSYSGLSNFSPKGQTPEANGKFRMEYIGGGKWEGTLAGQKFTVPVGKTDKIDLPFVNDPNVIGEWVSVDFVSDPGRFEPEKQAWEGNLYLKGLTFLENGKMSERWLRWTKNMVIHKGDKTASRYETREINGSSYLFFEWKSGDVTIAGMKPRYYVLKKKAVQ